MGALEALIAKIPEQAWTIRRLQMRDAEFRSLCEDYDMALQALEHWQSVGGPAHARVDEYRQFAKELQDQALEYVKSHGRS
jgi:hypothetical protein